MKKQLLFLFIFLTYLSYCQNDETIYLDENYLIISLEDFNIKASSDFYFVATTTRDSKIIKKLRFSEFFSKLETQKKRQLNKLFDKRYDIDSSKVWLIHYIDSLPNVKEMPKKSGLVFIDSLGKPYGDVLSRNAFNRAINNKSKNGNSNSISINRRTNFRHKHVTSYDDFIKIILNEKRKYRKYDNLELVHFYNYNKGFPEKDILGIWYNDINQVLKNTFTDGMMMYKNIILYPDGSFCLNPTGIKRVKKLLKRKLFNKEYKKWKEKYNTLN